MVETKAASVVVVVVRSGSVGGLTEGVVVPGEAWVARQVGVTQRAILPRVVVVVVVPATPKTDKNIKTTNE